MFPELCRKYELLIAERLGRPVEIKVREDNQNYICNFEVHVKEQAYPNNYVSHSRLLQLPGCCGVMVSTASVVYPNCRNRGVGTLMNKFRQELAYALGYTILLCTDVTNNDHQRKILAKNGWQDLYSFINRRTHNNVAISVIHLREALSDHKD